MLLARTSGASPILTPRHPRSERTVCARAANPLERAAFRTWMPGRAARALWIGTHRTVADLSVARDARRGRQIGWLDVTSATSPIERRSRRGPAVCAVGLVGAAATSSAFRNGTLTISARRAGGNRTV